MSERKYYCLCDSNCKFETMTKEQIIAAITQMMATGSIGDVDTGFVTTIKEKNMGASVTFWVGTRAQYNKIEKPEQNCLYIFTDDKTWADFERIAANLVAECESAVAIANEAKAEIDAAVKEAQAATKAANEATQAAEGTKLKRLDHKHVVETSASQKMTITERDAHLFYIVEVVNMQGESDGTSTEERYTMMIDRTQVNSGRHFYFAGTNVAIYFTRNSLENNGVLVKTEVNVCIDEEITEGSWRICRFIGYGIEANEPVKYYASKLLQIADAEVGYLEKASSAQLDDKTANAGSNNYTKYARDLDAIADFYNTPKQSVAWCCVFVHWCFVQAFGVEAARALCLLPSKSLGAGVGYCMNYYKNAGQFYTSSPKVGDQIFFGDADSQDHTGIVYKVDSTKVYTIEGNTTDPTGASSYNGVYRKEYAIGSASILGYGRPKYDAE